jgi:ketosteroid isomerase-like protein
MSEPSVESELRGAVQRFLDAIDRADRDALAPLWCDDASMYFPFANSQDLVRGREAVLARFDRMFADLRTRNPGPGPYIGFRTDAFECLALDARHAVVYAVLAFAAQRGRRTLLFRREADGWRLLHVHASNMDSRRS